MGLEYETASELLQIFSGLRSYFPGFGVYVIGERLTSGERGSKPPPDGKPASESALLTGVPRA